MSRVLRDKVLVAALTVFAFGSCGEKSVGEATGKTEQGLSCKNLLRESDFKDICGAEVALLSETERFGCNFRAPNHFRMTIRYAGESEVADELHVVDAKRGILETTIASHRIRASISGSSSGRGYALPACNLERAKEIVRVVGERLAGK